MSDPVVPPGDTPRVDGGQQADAAIYEVLSAIGFERTHPHYQRFIHVTAETALRQVGGMIANGAIFTSVRRRNPQIKLYAPRYWSRDDQAEITNLLVSTALKEFEEDLADGRWNPEAPKSLMSYLIDICIYRFPNVFKEWLNRLDDRELDDPVDPHDMESYAQGSTDLIDALVSTVDFQRWLDAVPLTSKERSAFCLYFHEDLPHAEIVKKLGLSSLRASENLISRARNKIRLQLEEGGEHGTQRA